MKAVLLTLVLAGAAASVAFLTQDHPAPQAPPKEVVVVKAADIKWGDHPFVQGAKMAVESGDPAKGPSVVMMKFPKGMTIPAHWHTASETVTLVRGTALFGTGETMDEAKGTELTAGSYMVIPSKQPHWAIAREEFVITIALDRPADFNLCGEKKQ